MFKKAISLVLFATVTISNLAYSHPVNRNSEPKTPSGNRNTLLTPALLTTKTNKNGDSSLSNIAEQFKNRPWQYAEAQQHIVLPYTSSLWDFEKNLLEDISRRNSKAKSRLSSRIDFNKALLDSNKQQLDCLTELHIIEQKSHEDSLLTAKIVSDSTLSVKYGDLFENINQVYKDTDLGLKRQIWFSNVYRSVTLLMVSKHLNGFKTNLKQQPKSNKQIFFNANIQILKDSLNAAYATFNIDADRGILRKMIGDAANFSLIQRVTAVNKIVSRQNGTREGLDQFIDDTFGFSRLKDENYVLNTLLKSPASISNYNDAMLIFEHDLANQMVELQNIDMQRKSLLEQYFADYLNLKSTLATTSFTLSKP